MNNNMTTADLQVGGDPKLKLKLKRETLPQTQTQA